MFCEVSETKDFPDESATDKRFKVNKNPKHDGISNSDEY